MKGHMLFLFDTTIRMNFLWKMNGVHRKKPIDYEEELYRLSAPRTRQKFEMRHSNSEVSNMFQDSLRSLISRFTYFLSIK